MSKFFCHTPLSLIRRGHFQVTMFAHSPECTIRPLYLITLSKYLSSCFVNSGAWGLCCTCTCKHTHMITFTIHQWVYSSTHHQFLSRSAWKLLYTVLRLLLFFPLVTLKKKKKGSFKRVISFLPHWHFKPPVFKHWEQCSWTEFWCNNLAAITIIPLPH